MKKYLFIWAFLCLVLCNLFLLAHAQQAEQVEVTHCSGKVEVLLEGADEYTDAEDNMVLTAGDKIKTASGASVELSFNEANTNLVRLDENTGVNISLSGDEKLEMTEGEVFSSISELPSGSAFEIRTPTAVSGARGTDWVTKVTEGGTDVEALEKEPYVKHFESAGNLSKQIVSIAAGQMTTVRKFQKPEMLRPLAEMRRQKWQQVKKEVVQRAGEAILKRKELPPFNRKDFINKIKEKANLKGRDFNQMKNDMLDKAQGALAGGGKEKLLPGGEERKQRMEDRKRGMEQTGQQDFRQMKKGFMDRVAGVLISGEKEGFLPDSDANGYKPEGSAGAPAKEYRDQGDKIFRENAEERNPRMEKKRRAAEQSGQRDLSGMRNDLRDTPGVLVSGEKEKLLSSPEADGRKFEQERNQRREDRTSRMEEKALPIEQMGKDVVNGIKKFVGDEPRSETRPGNQSKSQPRKSPPQKMLKPRGPVRR